MRHSQFSRRRTVAAVLIAIGLLCPLPPLAFAAFAGPSQAEQAARSRAGTGAAPAVGGAVLWLTAPARGEAKPGVTSVGIGAGTFTIGARF